MYRYASFLAAFLVLVASLPAASSTGVHQSALEPAASGGLAVLDRALVKLSGHRRMLIVGAHPDDEDNALLAYASRGLGADVAYLSLSRGEGGQNLIGTELGTELGVIRTGELLAARALEDGRQYFTRAFDFGYTRSLDETFSRWPREILQQDAVRVARRFKPQVVVAVFPASERARHGQHHASAVIAEDLFELAGDHSAFPELEAEGLEAWTPQALYRRSWGPQEATSSFSLGQLDPVTGRSLGQLAAESRSLHRSQDMGRVQRIGSFEGGLVWIAGGAGAGGADLFAGIDTRLAAIASGLPESPLRRRLEKILEEVEDLAVATRKGLSPSDLGAAVRPLAYLASLLDEAGEVAEMSGSRAVENLVAEKRRLAAVALAAAAGVVVDARVDRETIPVGEDASVLAEVWRPGGTEVEVLRVGFNTAAGWTVGEPKKQEADDGSTGVERWRSGVQVPPGSEPSVPYFLRSPRQGDLYDWRHAYAETLGEPFSRPPLIAVFDLEVAGVQIHLEREAVYRYGDQAFGEIRRPVRAVPRVEIELDEGFLMWRRGETAVAEIEIVVRSNVEQPVAGRLRVETPEGWRVLGETDFLIEESRGSLARRLRLSPEVVPGVGRSEFRFQAEFGEGSSSGSFPVLEYPHVRPRVAPREARLEMSVFDLELPAMSRIGYVLGASDRVPAVLESLGVPVTVLSGETLSLRDLDAFDVIVVGSRAYETDAGLRNANPRLLEYVRRGGTLVVQYQQYQFVEGEYAPLPLQIGRPHGRITDETAVVRIIDGDHDVFHRPNLITAADWEGWVQERGLYFPESWDESYRPLLAMQDPGRAEERGALLVTGFGEGLYIYSGLSFFRQLPAGVPGAIRLFANLLAAGQEDTR